MRLYKYRLRRAKSLLRRLVQVTSRNCALYGTLDDIIPRQFEITPNQRDSLNGRSTLRAEVEAVPARTAEKSICDLRSARRLAMSCFSSAATQWEGQPLILKSLSGGTWTVSTFLHLHGRDGAPYALPELAAPGAHAPVHQSSHFHVKPPKADLPGSPADP